MACESSSYLDVDAEKLSLEQFQRAHDRTHEMQAISKLAMHYAETGDFRSSIPYLERGIELFREDGKLSEEAHLLSMLGEADNAMGNSQPALSAVKEAIRIYETIGDHLGEAAATTILGEIYAPSDIEKAQAAFTGGLKLSSEPLDTHIRGAILNDEGYLIQYSNPDKAFQLYKEALALENTVSDCRNRAAILANIASAYEDQGKSREALESYSEALKLNRVLGNKSDQAEILHAEAKTYEDLGDLSTALLLFHQSLGLKRSIGALPSEGPTLSAIANISWRSGNPSRAIREYSEAMVLLKQSGDLYWQALTLNNLGALYLALGRHNRARYYFEDAIEMAARSKNRLTPAISMWNLGRLEGPDAEGMYFNALHAARELNQPELEGLVDASLMTHFRRRRRYDVAIFFGKRALDIFQSLRHNMDGLSDDLVADFVQTKAQSYRELAEILIDRGRLAEAEQVLDLLKTQEYSDYVRGSHLETTASPSRTSTEDSFETQYQRITDNIVDLNKQLHALELDGHRTPAKQAEFERLRTEVAKEDETFDEYLHHLYSALADQDEANDKIQNLRRTASSFQDAIARNPGTVGIYTVQGESRLRLIVITSSEMVWRSYPISKKELAEKCYDFLRRLSYPGNDPRSAAKDLFNIIFGPIQKDIAAAGGKTLVWHLDGTLRYIPMGALLDARSGRYLVEQYAMVNYAAFNFYLADKPDLRHVSAIAMGISRTYEGFQPLPNVKEELNGIVKDPTVAGSHGRLAGTILLDDKFTWKAMDDQIGSQAIVHIASHFVLSPGSADLSYLLLAGKDTGSVGYHLSVADLKNDRQLNIAGKELVTLSACQTASGTAADRLHYGGLNSGDGFEVEGVSDAVLEKRAKAVISSLWEVNDESTGALMADFYRLWIASSGGVTKAEALRRAQLDLLQGRIKPRGGSDPGTTDFGHPYYWAPFVLMGNWQ